MDRWFKLLKGNSYGVGFSVKLHVKVWKRTTHYQVFFVNLIGLCESNGPGGFSLSSFEIFFSKQKWRRFKSEVESFGSL